MLHRRHLQIRHISQLIGLKGDMPSFLHLIPNKLDDPEHLNLVPGAVVGVIPILVGSTTAISWISST